jgi:integrase
MHVERIGPVSLTGVAGSPYYYARYRKDGRQITRSLKTNDVHDARQQAQAIAEKLGYRKTPEKIDYSFSRFAADTIEADRMKVKRGERAPTVVSFNEWILKKHLTDRIGHVDIRKLDYQRMQEVVDELTDLDLKSTSIKRIMAMVSKTLKTAVRAGVLTHVPMMPEISLKQGTRGWFSQPEFDRLLKSCADHAAANTKVRSQIVGDELRWFIMFMVDTFLRPSDAKLLRHRHIEIVRTNRTQYLRISTDFSKTVATPIISMPGAVEVYEQILQEQKANGFGAADDFLFLPSYKARNFAYELLRRQFRVVTESAGLSVSPTGEPRTIYSLRHTAIMSRLISGDAIDLLTLARNARTSVEMIDRFYAKHLTAEMNVEQLHGGKLAFVE